MPREQHGDEHAPAPVGLCHRRSQKSPSTSRGPGAQVLARRAVPCITSVSCCMLLFREKFLFIFAIFFFARKMSKGVHAAQRKNGSPAICMPHQILIIYSPCLLPTLDGTAPHEGFTRGAFGGGKKTQQKTSSTAATNCMARTESWGPCSRHRIPRFLTEGRGPLSVWGGREALHSQAGRPWEAGYAWELARVAGLPAL